VRAARRKRVLGLGKSGDEGARRELKAEARGKKDKAEAERDVLAKIAEMSEPDRSMAERVHAIVKASAPGLSPKLWYGMPAYARTARWYAFSRAGSSTAPGTRRSA